jgi:hypothetical protein
MHTIFIFVHADDTRTQQSKEVKIECVVTGWRTMLMKLWDREMGIDVEREYEEKLAMVCHTGGVKK